MRESLPGLLCSTASFARRHRAALLIVTAAIVPLLVRVALLPWTGVPQPVIHDEFSYLLAADTFASGRLAKAPHPLAEHFSAMQVLQRPACASKYLPGQGLALALGQVLAGHPWAGVLLGMALFLGAAAWMLTGWLPWRWALAATALLALRFGPQQYWWNSYWGGGLPAAGGAAPAGRPLLPFAALIDAHNRAVTGSPWQLPHMRYEREHSAGPRRAGTCVCRAPRPTTCSPATQTGSCRETGRDRCSCCALPRRSPPDPGSHRAG